MIRKLSSSLACVMALIFAASVFAGQPVDFRLKDGTRWRGEVDQNVKVVYLNNAGTHVPLAGKLVRDSDVYIIVESDIAGRIQPVTIFKLDIVSIEAASHDDAASIDANPAKNRIKPSDAGNDKRDVSDLPGVFLLPLVGGVGTEVRHDEMEKIGKHADKYGDGQIIILKIDSPGGAVTEMEKIHDVLADIKKRHRLICWIEKAISAGCATALHCDEIYFTTEGTAGAMTAFAGGVSWKDGELAEWLRRSGEWAEDGGRSKYIAHSMIHAPLICSYDKDSKTGEVTFYNDMRGQFVLSRPQQNLVFTSTTAVHSGFADGIADTEEQLAKLLDMPYWYTTDDYGQKLSDNWLRTVDRARKKMRTALDRYNIGLGDADAEEQLGYRIQQVRTLITWGRRAPNVLMYEIGLTMDVLENWLEDLQYQMTQLKKARSGRR